MTSYAETRRVTENFLRVNEFFCETLDLWYEESVQWYDEKVQKRCHRENLGKKSENS